MRPKNETRAGGILSFSTALHKIWQLVPSKMASSSELSKSENQLPVADGSPSAIVVEPEDDDWHVVVGEDDKARRTHP